jgi:GT2 family glycosyltransferase
MIQTKIQIGIIIPTYNRKEYLSILLAQLDEEQRHVEAMLQIVIVDDGCSDSTSTMLQSKFPDVTILRGPGNWWWTKSINEGTKHLLRAHQPKYILLLNDDSQISPGYIRSLIESAHRAGDNCIIGSLSATDKQPQRISFAGTRHIDWLKLKKTNYYKPFELAEKLPSEGLFPTYCLNGRGTFLKTSTFENLGFLNEKDFPQYGSDDDLALRAWGKGYQVLISYSCKIIDRANETSVGTAFRQDKPAVFFKSFFTWNSVNYIPKQAHFFYQHGIKILLPFYLLKFLIGTSYAYFFKYKKMKYEI